MRVLLFAAMCLTSAYARAQDSASESTTPEPPTVVAASAPSEPPAEAATPAPSEPPAEAATPAPSEPPAEAATSAPSEPPAEAATSAPSEPPAETAALAEPAPPPESPTSTAKQNSIYARPFIVSRQRASIGGYAETSFNYARTDGVADGPSFEFQRFNLFVFSPISRFVRLLAEIEFEHGTEEIRLETAVVDFEIVPELVVRAGILLAPLGAFNQAHDGPLWDFVNRPLVSTTIIPATMSEVGAGLHGTVLVGPVDLDYQAYATQGLSDGILDNTLGRTSIPDGRDSSLFEEDNNGSPAFTGRVALRLRRRAELGLSGYRGAFNTYVVDGLHVDERRDLTIATVDYRVSLSHLEVRGEAAFASIDVPESLRSTFGDRQWGVFVDAVCPVYRFPALGYDATRLDVGARFEYVDYNVGDLPTTKTNAGDDRLRVVGVLAWRPSAETVVRVNYAYDWQRDLTLSPTVRSASLQIGLATYF